MATVNMSAVASPRMRRWKTLALNRCIAPLGLMVWSVFGAVADAHTTLVENTAPADTYFRVRFVVAHGCGLSPTHTLRVQIPPGVEFASVWHKPGWTARPMPAPKAGDEGQVKLVKEVIWTGSKIPAKEYDYFELEVKLPDEEGRVLYFKVVQLCDQGELRWIEVPEKGKSADDLKFAAPSLTLTARQKK